MRGNLNGVRGLQWLRLRFGTWARFLVVAFALSGLVLAPSGHPAASSGLVAAYSFNEGSGTTVVDSSGRGNNGAVGSATWAASGKFGGALSFNGTSAKVTVPDAASLDLTTAMTLEAWVNPATVDNSWRDVIYKGNDNYYLMATSQPGSRPDVGGTFAGQGADLPGTAALAANTWAYLAATYDGSTLRLYVNGTQVATQARTGALATSTNPLTIGGDPIFGQYFAGLIDEVRVYNVALSAAQIQSDMNAPVAPDTQAPSAPGTLSGSAASGTQINLSWGVASDNVGVTGYQVERCQGAGCSSFAQVGTPSGTTFNDSGLSANTSYSYRVRAVDAAGNAGPYSNTFTVSTQAPDNQPPSAPGTLSGSAASGTQINLSWGVASDNVGVTGYQVERCQGAGCSSFAQVGTPSGTTFNDSGLSANTSYSYRVRAVDAAGNAGPYSNTFTTTTPAASSGLVAAYSFNEGSGTTVVDSSGRGNNGAVGSATWAASGKFGGALSFNGTSAKVTVPDAASLDLTTAMTLEAWVNPATVDNSWRDVIYKGNDNYYLMATSQPGSRPDVGGTFAGQGADLPGTAALAANTWAYLAATYDGSTLRLYVNGTQVATQARTGALATSTNPLTIGGDPIFGQYFAGLIDEVRVYNVALSAAQIQSDMNAPVAPDTQAPSAPGTLSGSAASGTQINLSWGVASDNVGVTGYQVERCQGAGCSSFAQVGTPSGTTFNDSGLSANTSYSYRVRAVDAAGNAGPYSNTFTVSTQAPDNQPPSAPGTLSGSAASGTQINLSWGVASDNVGVTGYQVERCQGAGCSSFAQVGTPSGTTFNDSGLSANTSYSYRVRAVDAAGNAGPYSNTFTVSTQAPDNQPPSVPGTLTATAAGSTQINLSWGAATDNVGVTGYRIDRCQGAGCTNFSHLVQLTGTGTTYSDTNLAGGTSYSYQARAMDGAGNVGLTSNVATTTTQSTAGTLVAAYSFDEGSGTTAGDTSGNGNNGAIGSATWSASGRFGGALSFNGTSAKVTVADTASLHLSTGMTLEAWVSPATVDDSWRDVIYKGNDNYFLMATSQPTSSADVGGTFAGAGADVAGSGVLPANTWSYLAGTYDGSTLRLYVNGALVASQAQSGSIATSANPLTIGGDPIWGQYFKGLIDEVRVYNVALNAAQIQADMSGGVNYPSAPGTLTAATASSSEVDLNWLPSSDAHGITGYRVERCQGASCTTFTQIATPSATTYNDTGLSADTTYRYRVRAVNSLGNVGDYSNVAAGFTGLAISPRVTDLTFTRTQLFNALGAGSSSVTWSVDGTVGGTASSGTITTTGLYSPPSAVGTHTVTVASSTESASATVYVTNYAGVLTSHNDLARTGANTSETALARSNVNTTSFGKLFADPLDGITYGSPLYLANVNIPGQGFHNMVYVATAHDSVYAYDADGLSSTPIWKDSFINPAAGITTVPAADTGECCDIAPEIGITGTPVIDPQSGTLYLVAKTKEVSGGTTRYVQRLHALDITTGAEKFGGPVVISASVTGSGNGSSGNQLPFDSPHENQHAGLLLENGELFIGFSSHGDIQPYHGWVLGYNASTLQQTFAYCVTRNGEGGGVWLSGGGPAADSNGSVYFGTGDGTFDANVGGGVDYGDSIIRFTQNGTVADYFTPHDESTIDNENKDLGAGGLVLLPDQSGAHPHELVTAGKNGTIYLVDRDNMGHYNSANDNQIVQELPNIFPNGQPDPGNFSMPVYWNGLVYFGPSNDNVQAFRLTNGLLSTTPATKTAEVYQYRGGTMSISANGNSSGILWALQSNNGAGVLRAYDATNLTNVFYTSDQAGTRDSLGGWNKFSPPVIANGRVLVASTTALVGYGLLP